MLRLFCTLRESAVGGNNGTQCWYMELVDITLNLIGGAVRGM